MNLQYSNTFEYTLTSSNWAGSSAPYTYTIECNCDASSLISISSKSTASVSQVEAFGKALVIGGSQSTGSFQLIALKSKPTIDIPIVITIGGVLDAN